jgi:hypothetical protein
MEDIQMDSIVISEVCFLPLEIKVVKTGSLMIYVSSGTKKEFFKKYVQNKQL